MDIQQLQIKCHEASYAAGWWHDPETGLPYMPGQPTLDGKAWEDLPTREQKIITCYWPFVVATKMVLIHSEISEGLEAFRVDAQDDKLAHRLGLECELADSIIRQCDLAEAINRVKKNNFDLGGAITEKMAFNLNRPDHKLAARRKAGGKKF